MRVNDVGGQYLLCPTSNTAKLPATRVPPYTSTSALDIPSCSGAS